MQIGQGGYCRYRSQSWEGRDSHLKARLKSKDVATVRAIQPWVSQPAERETHVGNGPSWAPRLLASLE
jgi:hypothetical protein